MDKEYLFRESEVFCVAPWAHMHVLTNGEIYPCCMSAHDSDNSIGHLRRGDTLESAWNSEKMRALRLRMLRGEKSSLCERCYKNEELGQKSWRTSTNGLMPHHYPMVEKTDEDGGLDEVNLPYLDIRFSNVCNLKCRICTPKLSSSWYQDGVAMGMASRDPALIRATEDPQVLWDQILPLIPKAERFHFAGGEPLVMEEHYQLLDMLLEEKMYDVRLTYNTNLSRFRYKEYDVMEMWKQFSNIHVRASLDGMGERGDYMRKGQKWDQIVSNRERMLKECPHVEFCILATVNIMNVLHMPDFYREWVERGYIRPSEIHLNILFEPEYYNIRGLPLRLKKRVEEKYRGFIEDYVEGLGEEAHTAKEHFESVLQYMNVEDMDVTEEFRRYTNDLDILRGERFKEVFPEISELVEPTTYVAHLYRGRSKRKFRRLDEAIVDFDQAIEEMAELGPGVRYKDFGNEVRLDSTLTQAYIERGQLKVELERMEEALQDFTQAAELDVNAYAKRGQLKIELGDMDGALQDFDRAAELDATTYAKRGQLKRERGASEGAIQDFTRAAELEPSGTLEYINQRIEESQEGKIDLLPNSEDLKEEDIFSTLAFGYYLRGIARRELGDTEGALLDFGQALELEPTLAQAYVEKEKLKQRGEDGKGRLEEDTRESKWWLRVEEGNKAILTFPPDSPEIVRVAIEKADTKSPWDIQLNCANLAVRANRGYVFSFRARADSSRSVILGLAKAHEPWDGLGLYKDIVLTSEWQDFQEEFVPTADEEDARIHFDLGVSDIPIEVEGGTLSSLPRD